MNVTDKMQQELQGLKKCSNLRTLPALIHEGREVIAGGQRMLNLSSNDYLGLAADRNLREEFLQELTADSFLPTSSSSRLLTGNFTVYAELEQTLAQLFGTEAALVFNSGYHANTGILPAVSDTQTLILADKLVHASLIDGIRLSSAKCIRYRHNDLKQLERLLAENHAAYRQVIVVTESIFSMDGDIADLKELVRLKQPFPAGSAARPSRAFLGFGGQCALLGADADRRGRCLRAAPGPARAFRRSDGGPHGCDRARHV